ncbi:MAG: ATP-binding protein [Dehalococcoidia bacterium]
MINKPLDAVDPRDIELLVENAVRERRTLEYKAELPGNTDAEKREFLSDVASLATASGGDVVFGVLDRRDDEGRATGVPDSICGLGNANLDAEILRLESLCRDSIDPRIHGIQTKGITDISPGAVILMRVPRSLFGPHRVAYKGSSRFYSRNSAGKYPLDTLELKTAFAAAEELPERIRRFRDERLAQVVADQTPTALLGTSRVVLHVTHGRAFDPSAGVDFAAVSPVDFPPLYAADWNNRINFDGLLTYSATREGGCSSYAQLFRSGAIEAVDARMLTARGDAIPTEAYEKEIIESLTRYLRLLETLQVGMPLFVMLSLFGVKGHRLGVENVFPSDLLPIERDLLVMPELVVEEWGIPVDVVLKPAFDAVWQAGGMRGSRNYDATGRWVGRQ